MINLNKHADIKRDSQADDETDARRYVRIDLAALTAGAAARTVEMNPIPAWSEIDRCEMYLEEAVTMDGTATGATVMVGHASDTDAYRVNTATLVGAAVGPVAVAQSAYGTGLNRPGNLTRTEVTPLVTVTATGGASQDVADIATGILHVWLVFRKVQPFVA